ncbi:MAG TPA: hypothetical protein PKC22_11525 [Rhodocyclaceae bacterium]|nr:hypothetical protein [Rhodocyclaceae bacterium]
MICSVTLADLMRIADAACELDTCQQFYVDQPSRQCDLARFARDLHDIVERAAGRHAGRWGK